jgi:hypothetical protein
MTTPPLDQPGISVAAMQDRMAAQLSRRARLGHVLLLLAATAMTGTIGSLWITEPAIPRRTHLAFAVMVLIGVSWAVYAVWVLTRRRVLLGQHRVVAGGMAVTFCAIFTVGCAVVALSGAGRPAWAASAVGAVMLLISTALLAQARRAVADLMSVRERLSR